MYTWLIEPPRSCDESSVMSFFVLLQYNPQAYDECKKILRHMADTDDGQSVRNYSAKLAAMVESVRKFVHPAGNVHAGQNARIVHTDRW